MRLLDLYCGAGGAAMGYHRAGFDEIDGVDIEEQPRYPFNLIKDDALAYLMAHGKEYDAIHASPPCQRWAQFANAPWLPVRKVYPDLLTPTITALERYAVPWVIENIPTSPLQATMRLCGSSFGLMVRRHRHFQSNVALTGLPCRHNEQGSPIGVYGNGGPKNPGGRGRRYKNKAEAAEAMGIDWMTVREMCQAIPPVYMEYIGKQLLGAIR